MELEARDYRRGGLILAQVNKVHHVHTIARVAAMLGEDEDWLWDVAVEMDQEDGLIWVYGPGDESVMAFTDFGIETLTGLVRSSRPIPTSSSDQPIQSDSPAAYAACLPRFRGPPQTEIVADDSGIDCVMCGAYPLVIHE